MRRPTLGLTARLAIAGIASALVPFAVGGAILLSVPDEVASRQVDADLNRALDQARAGLQASRADLEFALARVSERDLAALVRGGDAGQVEADVRRAWAQTTGRSPDELELELRRGDPRQAGDGAVVAYLAARAGARRVALVVRDPEAEQRVLRAAARDTDVDLALLSQDGVLETATGHGSRERMPADDWQVTEVEAGEQPVVDFSGDEPSRHRAGVIDQERDLVVVAALDGGPLDLLLRGRGREIQAALVLLLAAGMLCAVAVALIMNRMLGRVATTAERISGGDFETRLPIVGTDAGARVASSLNELASELQDRIGTLERTVDRLDRTLAAIDDGVCTWNEAGEIETWNAGATAITGISARDAWPGVPTIDALQVERIPGRRRVLLPTAAGETHLAVELYVRRMRDGGVLQVFRDAAPALSIEQARKNFLVTAAHELRTPLTSILGFAATLADEQLTLQPAIRRTAIRQILEDAERLDRVVDALFESSLLARDKLEVSLSRVSVASAIDEAIDSVGAAGVVLDGVAPGLEVRADRAALVRALGALLDNAAKYGGPPVELEASAEHSRVRLVVRDHGGGIPLESQAAVFEPFFRRDPEMRHDVGGAGMGLYTARRLIEAMGGSISLRSICSSDQPRRSDDSSEPVRQREESFTEFALVLPAWLPDGA